MKKLLKIMSAIVLVVILGIGLAACDNSSNNNNGNNNNGNNPVTVAEPQGFYAYKKIFIILTVMAM